jgi:hypothetical protein
MEIEREMNAISVSATTTPKRYYADRAGIFVSGIDGFERILTPQTINDVTFDELQAYLSQRIVREHSSQAIGKIVETDRLNFLASVPSDQVHLLGGNLLGDERRSVTINFSLSDMTTVPARLESIKTDKDSDFAMALFSTTHMAGELSFVRTAVADISLNTYEGLRVSRDAIRYEDEQPGVFVRTSAGVQFRRLDIVFEDDGFVLSAQRTDNNTYLRLYDQIITDGRNLVDKAG